jgi:membrane fusion protein, heavy metal efflux system
VSGVGSARRPEAGQVIPDATKESGHGPEGGGGEEFDTSLRATLAPVLQPRSPWVMLGLGAMGGALVATAIAVAVTLLTRAGAGPHQAVGSLASPVPPPSPFKVEGDGVKLGVGVPMRFVTAPVTLGSPLPRTPVTARVSTIESLTAPSFAPLDGRVAEVAVRIGDRVKEGDKLVLVRSGDLASMQRDLKAAQLAIKTKQALMDRLKQLVESRAAPQNDVLVAQSDLNEARLTASAAAAKLRSLAVRQQGDTGYWVLATRSGTVVQLDAGPGKQVGPDKDHPVATVADLDEVLVVGDVPQKEALSLKAGMDVLVTQHDSGAEPLHGTIEVVSDVLDPERQTVPIRIRVKNLNRDLRPLSFVEARFSPSADERLLNVPTEAVVSDGATSIVFVEVSPGVLRRRPVRTGRQNPDRTEILSGLAQGEMVVVRGALLLLNAIDVKG